MGIQKNYNKLDSTVYTNNNSPGEQLKKIKSMQLIPPVTFHTNRIMIPGSKSYSNRALLIASAAHSPSKLFGLLDSDDVHYALKILQKLGCQISDNDDHIVLIPPTYLRCQQHETLFLGSAGTLARFLPPLLAVRGQGTFHLDGTAQLRDRPLKELLVALQHLGVQVHGLQRADSLPLTLEGGSWQGGQLTIDGSISSQFVSGLLIAACFANYPTVIRLPDKAVQHAYIDMTCSLLKQFGAKIESLVDGCSWSVTPSTLIGQTLTIEADVSTSCYFWALAAITGNPITVCNVLSTTLQPDYQFLHILEQMGCTVIHDDSGITVQRTGNLISPETINVHEFSDQLLTLAVLATYADKPTYIHGASHVRYHESNRLESAARILQSVGIVTLCSDDGITVFPGKMHSSNIPTFSDHRVAMASSLLSYHLPGLIIDDPSCVAKTCPMYFSLLEQLGFQCIPSMHHD